MFLKISHLTKNWVLDNPSLKNRNLIEDTFHTPYDSVVVSPCIDLTATWIYVQYDINGSPALYSTQ